MKRPILICELGKEHKGNVELAKQMIREAADSQFNWIKNQFYSIEDLIDGHPNTERYKRCHLTLEEHHELKEYSQTFGMDYFLSVFSKRLLKAARSVSSRIKVPSTYFNRVDYFSTCLSLYPEVHTSTGFSDSSEVANLISKYNQMALLDNNKIIYYQCTSTYPSIITSLRLERIRSLGLKGLSYHNTDARAIMMALSAGIEYLELHFSLDYPGPSWCYTPGIMRCLNEDIDRVIEAFKDRPMTDIELENFEFYKGEYKDV